MLFLLRVARPVVVAVRYNGRAFHLTQSRRNTENKEAFFKAFQSTSLFSRLTNHPEAFVALEEFSKLLQAQGVDLSSGKPPSTLQMLKLASNSEFRESASRVREELQKAGVDVQSKELMQEMMELMKLKSSGDSK